MATRWEEYRKKNGVTPLDMLNPNSTQASDEKAEQRLSICLECPELLKLTKQCKKCGCFMQFKTKLDKAICPLNKW